MSWPKVLLIIVIIIIASLLWISAPKKQVIDVLYTNNTQPVTRSMSFDPPKEEPSYWKIYSIDFFGNYHKDIIDVSKMNGNMAMIFFGTEPLPDGSLDTYRYESKEEIESMFEEFINASYEHNMHVIFDLEVSGPGLVPSQNMEAFRENYKKFVIDWAKFCQNHGIYAFNVNSELDNEFFVPQECEEDCKNNLVSALAQELLNETRKYYTGKIGVGVIDTWSSDYNLTGYDFFTTNLPCGDGNIDSCIEFYGEAISKANALKKKYKVPKFIIGEVDIFSENDATPEGMEQVQGFEIVTEQDEVNFYNQFFEKYSDNVDGITITYSFPLGVKTGPAKDIISKWFGKLP